MKNNINRTKENGRTGPTVFCLDSECQRINRLHLLDGSAQRRKWFRVVGYVFDAFDGKDFVHRSEEPRASARGSSKEKALMDWGLTPPKPTLTIHPCSPERGILTFSRKVLEVIDCSHL